MRDSASSNAKNNADEWHAIWAAAPSRRTLTPDCATHVPLRSTWQYTTTGRWGENCSGFGGRREAAD